MVIKSRFTGLEQVITEKDWQAIKDRGHAARFDVLQQKQPQQAQQDKNPADFSRILQEAKEALAEERLAEAKVLFEEAAGIKSTPYIKRKLSEISAALEALKEQEE